MRKLGNYRPEEQYAVLFWTLDELVHRYGKAGVFHVNDLYEEYALFAAQKLQEYATNQGYDLVIIEPISGDYQNLDSARLLSSYGKNKYTSLHLKNPEISFYHDRMDGDNLYASDESRQRTRFMLKKLANLSDTGLYLFILDNDYFIPPAERKEFIEKNIIYHATDAWKSVPYIFPEGDLMDKGLVFHIASDI